VTGTDAPAGAVVNAEEPVRRLLRDLRTSREGLSSREAARRLVAYGRNELERRGGRHLWRELGRQFAHPLALLLWAAAGLAWLGRIRQVATIAVTILAGPVNYLGVNPKISCHHLPQPSK